MKKGCLFILLFLLPSVAFPGTIYNLSPDLELSLENHLRISGNTFGNNQDLDSDVSDGVSYIGYAHDTSLNITEYIFCF